MQENFFKLLPHTADIKIQVRGATLDQVFAHAVVGMFQAIVPIAPGCQKKGDWVVCDELPVTRQVEVVSFDREALLVDFLSEALYLSDVHNEAYLDAQVHQLSDTSIKATLRGVPVKGFEVVEIKAVTYHDLSIEKTDDGFVATIVFDI